MSIEYLAWRTRGASLDEAVGLREGLAESGDTAATERALHLVAVLVELMAADGAAPQEQRPRS